MKLVASCDIALILSREVKALLYAKHIVEYSPKVNKTVQLMSPVVTEKIKYRIDFLMCPIE